MSDYTFKGMTIPERMVGGLERYVSDGVRAGSFLTAVICNDLQEAVSRAYEENIHLLPAYVGWLYNHAPASCWGSKEKMDAWIRLHRIEKSMEKES